MDKYNAPPKPKPGSGRGQRIARENMEKKRQEQADEQADKQTDNNQGKASSPGPSERLLRLRKAHHFPFAQQPLAPGTSQDVERTSRVIEPVPGGYKPKFLLEDERTEPFHSIDDYPMPKKHIPGYDTYNKVQGRIEQLMEGGWTEVDARMCVLQDEIDPVVRGKYRQESLRLKQQSTEVTASVDTSSKGKKRLARDTSSESDYTPSESTPSEGSDSDSDYRPQREDHDARAMGKGKHKASDVASDHEAEETIPSTDISDRRSSDVIVPLEHIPALVDAVIASKQPGAKQFDHNAFLRRIGCSGSAVVIDNTHGKAWKEHLKTVSAERTSQMLQPNGSLIPRETPCACEESETA